jgi:hypothetical protein
MVQIRVEFCLEINHVKILPNTLQMKRRRNSQIHSNKQKNDICVVRWINISQSKATLVVILKTLFLEEEFPEGVYIFD